jgi:hypothetical protein
MQSMTSSSLCMGLTICGIFRTMNLKFPTTSSRKYLGRHLNGWGSSAGRGSFKGVSGKLLPGLTSLSSHTMTYRMNCMDLVCVGSSSKTPWTANL